MSNSMIFNLPSIADAIRNMGYKGQEFINDKFSGVESATNGRGFVVCPLLADEQPVMDDSTEATQLRFRTCWIGMDNLEESQADNLCNWFNLNQSFTKMYRQATESSYDIWLEADLYVLDGMSVAAFQNRVEAFIKSYEYAMKCLERCSYIDKNAIIDRHNKAIEILDGLGEDKKEAITLYRINSYLGFAGSQNNFGDQFEIGKLLPKDDLVAVYWYTRASERGEPTAYYSLATILLESSRDNIDGLILAAQYAILAAEQLPEGKNKISAIETRELLRSIIGDENYELADAHARNFRPIYKEKWTLGDSPGPDVTVVPGSGALN